MQVSLDPKDIAPQLLHVLIFDLYELKPIKTTTINSRGIKNNRSSILPIKLMNKLIPKIGSISSMINEYIRKFLLALRKKFILLNVIYNFFFYLIKSY